MSWVRADRAHLDRVLYDAVVTWLQCAWPFGSIQYVPGPYGPLKATGCRGPSLVSEPS
jgi:hypothetical protein